MFEEAVVFKLTSTLHNVNMYQNTTWYFISTNTLMFFSVN